MKKEINKIQAYNEILKIIEDLNKEKIINKKEIEKIKEDLIFLRENHLNNKTNIENLKERIDKLLKLQEEDKNIILEKLEKINNQSIETATTLKNWGKILTVLIGIVPIALQILHIFFDKK